MKLLSSVLCHVSKGLDLAAQGQKPDTVWSKPHGGSFSSHVKRAAVRAAHGSRNLSTALVSCSFPLSQSQHLPAWPPKGCCASSCHIPHLRCEKQERRRERGMLAASVPVGRATA